MTIQPGDSVDTDLQSFTAIRSASTMTGIPSDGAGLTGAFYISGSSLYSIDHLKALIAGSSGPSGTFVTDAVDFYGGVTIADFLGAETEIATDSLAAASASMEKVGMTFSGYVYIPEGVHEISVLSDDGFELLINDVDFSSFAGTRSYRETSGEAFFEAGLYKIDLSYFENYGAQALTLEIDGEVVDQSAFYESLEAFDEAVAAADDDSPLTPVEDYHPSSVFGATAAAPSPEIAIGDLGNVPLVGTGLSGKVYDADWVRSISELGRLIDTDPTPDATFTATGLQYYSREYEPTLAEFLADDADSIVGDGDMIMDGTGIVLEGFIVIPEGEHTLTIRSDDGFALFLGGAQVARHDGERWLNTTTVEETFEGGLYEVQIAYFERSGPQGLIIEIDGLPIDGSAFYQSEADFAAQQAAPEVDSIPADEYHPGKVLGAEAYGDAFTETGDDTPERIEGKGGDDDLAGGGQVDHITGGYGDDKLDGGDGNDVLDGGRGSDLLLGGAGDDLLIARSDAGEQRIGQFAVNDVTRGDPEDEVNDSRQKLYGWENHPLQADDILVGGEGRDVFLISPQINAKQDIIEKHVRSDGTINWAGVAGENNEVHDHWVDMFGIDVIADYKAGEDKIAIIGHTVAPEITARRDVDGDGDLETIITVYSNQHGGGGAHDEDLIGQLIVHGDAVDLDDVEIDAGVTYGITETYEEIAEALFPIGPSKATVEVTQQGGMIDAGTGQQDPDNPTIEAAYDTRTFDPVTGEVDLGAVTGRPEDHIDNPYADMLEDLDAPPSSLEYVNSRAPFEPLPILPDGLPELADGLPPAIGFWRFDDVEDGVAADSRGGPDAVAYELYENQATPRLSGAETDGPTDGEGAPHTGASTGALTFDGEGDFAVISHDPAFQISQGTIALWVRPDNLADDQIMVSKDLRGSGEGGHFRLGHSDDGRIFLRMAEGDGDGNKSWTSVRSYLDEGEWSHIAVSFDDEGVTVFVDGRAIPDIGWVREEGNVDEPGEYTEAYFIQNQEPWILGADTAHTNISGTAAIFGLDDEDLDDAFQGAMADFGIWGGYDNDAVLSASQVRELFENGPGPNLDAPPMPPALDGTPQNIVGGNDDDQLEGKAGDDVIDGGEGWDSLEGGYGDDQLEGGDGDDIIDGGRGSDLLIGGDGDDLLISRSDVGEQRIGQIANGQPTREDPDNEVNPYYQKLFGWEDQPLIGDDILVGGAGRDTFYFNPLINAKLDIILEHVEDHRWINWAGVAGENNEVHDHWVDAFGIDVIADYVAGEDEIAIIGHTVAPEVSYKLIDSDQDGVAEDLVSIITVYSNQHGGGGAHDQDLIGQIVVYGDAVDAGSIIREAGVTHGVVGTVDEIIEAVAPTPGEEGRKTTGTITQVDPLTGETYDVVIGYDSRSYRVNDEGEVVVDLGDVIENPDEYVENDFSDQVDFQSARQTPAPNVLHETGPITFNEENPIHVIEDTAAFARATGTVLATFTANEIDGYQTIWSQDANGNGDGGHHTAWIDYAGRLKVRYQSDEDSIYLYADDIRIKAGDTHTIAFTFDGETAKLYVDDILRDSNDAVPTGTIGNMESLVLGASTTHRTPGELNNLRDHFEGVIHNFAFVDQAMTLAELILRQDRMLESGEGADMIEGGAGTDTAGYTGSDEGVNVDLTEGSGEGGDAEGDQLTDIENVVGSEFDDMLIGDGEDNTLTGGDGDDQEEGRGGNDILLGGDGDDMLSGDEGDDILQGGVGGDELHGATGIDLASYAGSAGRVVINLATGYRVGGDAAGDLFFDIEGLIGSGFNDVLVGDDGANILDGGDGDDMLRGGEGRDTLMGGDGFDMASYAGSISAVVINLATGYRHGGDAAGDTFEGIEGLTGTTGDDVLVGDVGANVLEGGAGDDVLRGGFGADILRGGAGIDMASYAGSGSRVVVNLETGFRAGGDAAGDRFSSIEGLTGSSQNDILVGNVGANILEGGAGDDILRGSLGADTLRGGAGIDIASYADSDARVIINLANGYRNGGDATGDTFSSIEGLLGSAYNDILVGGAGANVLEGGAGHDILRGQQNSDTFIFRFGSGIDSIVDFEVGTDKIDISSFGFGSFDALLNVTADINGSAHIALNGLEDVVHLNGVQKDDLLAGDFLL